MKSTKNPINSHKSLETKVQSEEEHSYCSWPRSIQIFEPELEELRTPEVYAVSKAVEEVLADQKQSKISSSIESKFYNSVDSDQEFGISRILSDKVYYLPQLLASPQLKNQDGTSSYILTSSIPDSNNGTITLEHRFQAPSSEIATEIAQQITEQLQGILQKIWMSTWKLANKLRSYTFTCQLTELMRITYPEREAKFQSHHKTEFYEHLRILESTKILYQKKGKNNEYQSIELRLLDIHSKKGKKDEYPQEISISILNIPSLQNEKMAFVGAAYKNTTLELKAEDISLASWLQARIAQVKDNPSGTINLDEEFLFKLSKFAQTAITNKSRARSLVVKKLDRLIEKKVIKGYEKPTIKTSNPKWVISFFTSAD